MQEARPMALRHVSSSKGVFIEVLRDRALHATILRQDHRRQIRIAAVVENEPDSAELAEHGIVLGLSPLNSLGNGLTGVDATFAPAPSSSPTIGPDTAFLIVVGAGEAARLPPRELVLIFGDAPFFL